MIEKILAYVGGIALIVLYLHYEYQRRQLSQDDTELAVKQAAQEAVSEEGVKDATQKADALESNYDAVRDEYLGSHPSGVQPGDPSGGSGTSGT